MNHPRHPSTPLPRQGQRIQTQDISAIPAMLPYLITSLPMLTQLRDLVP